MSIKTFINRPILSVMLSVVIVIIGIIGLLSLPLEQYPDIAPPTVKVSATYVGANAETVMKSVGTYNAKFGVYASQSKRLNGK